MQVDLSGSSVRLSKLMRRRTYLSSEPGTGGLINGDDGITVRICGEMSWSSGIVKVDVRARSVFDMLQLLLQGAVVVFGYRSPLGHVF